MLSALERVCLTSHPVEQSSQAHNQLVVFDAGVDALDTLIAEMKVGTAFHVLDANRDGIAQISSLLRQSPTVHLTLVAHGFSGGLQLGATTLELNNLRTYKQQLSGWFAQSSSATITLLSCHVAAGDAGSEFVTSLSEWTGAHVRAVATAIGNGQWPSIAMETFESTVISTYTETLELTFNTVLKDGVGNVDSLDGATFVAVSGDDKQVFVTSNKDNTLTVFDRDEDSGALIFNTVFKNGVDGVSGLNGATFVTTSGDGKQVFVASFVDGALTVFDRDAATGQLTLNTVFKDGIGDIDALDGARTVTISGDGKQVFVTSQRDDALTVFDRDTTTGELTLNTVFKDGVDGIDGFDGAFSVALSEDDTQVFVVSKLDDALTVFNRNAETGELTLNTVFKDGVDGVDGLNGANFVTASKDDTQVFVTGFIDDAMAVFDRDTTTGELTFNTVFKNGVGDVNDLDGAFSLAITGDGSQVFVAGENDDALTVFDREGSTTTPPEAPGPTPPEEATPPEEPNPPEEATPPEEPTPDLELTFNTVIKDGVGNVDSLDGATFVAVSGDDKQVFVTSNKDHTLTVFDRDETSGALTLNTVFKNGVDGVSGLNGATFVTTSGDGKQVFVASFVDGALTVFDRDAATGQLTFSTVFQDGVGDIQALKGAFSATVSGDGSQVFVASQRDDALTVFNRDAATGQLTLSTVFKDGVGDIDALDGARTVAISGDGKQVFVTSQRDDALTVFDRDTTTGALTLNTVFKDGVDGIDGFNGAFSVALSEDDTQVFVVSKLDDALTVFDRDAATGELTLNTVFKDGVDGVDGLNGANFVTASKDNRQVFVTGFIDDAMAVFDRDTTTGELTFNQVFKNGAGDVGDLNGAFSLAITGDGSQVFVASENDDALTIFDREGTSTTSSATAQLEGAASSITNGTTPQANAAALNSTLTTLSFADGPSFTRELANNTATEALLTDDASTIDLSNQSGSLNVAFTVFREAELNSTVGLYTTDTVDGHLIDSITGEIIKPGDAGYKAAALARTLDIQLTGSNGGESQSTGVIEGGGFLGMYLATENVNMSASDIYFSHAGANSGNADHVKLLGNNTFGFEDTAGLGDADFNDIVVQFSVV